MSATHRPSEAGLPGTHEVRRAWWSLLLVPFAFVAAFVVGEGIPAWLGHDAETTSPPWWVMMLALIAALVIVTVPLLVTGRFSRRAAAAHGQGAWMPLIISAAIVAGFVLVNLVSGLLVLVLG